MPGLRNVCDRITKELAGYFKLKFYRTLKIKDQNAWARKCLWQNN